MGGLPVPLRRSRLLLQAAEGLERAPAAQGPWRGLLGGSLPVGGLPPGLPRAITRATTTRPRERHLRHRQTRGRPTDRQAERQNILAQIPRAPVLPLEVTLEGTVYTV